MVCLVSLGLLHWYVWQALRRQLASREQCLWPPGLGCRAITEYECVNDISNAMPLKTYWGRVSLVCVNTVTIIGSNNGLSPGWPQSIIWTNDGILPIGPLGTNYNEILIKIQKFQSEKCIWKCRLVNGGHFVSASMCWILPILPYIREIVCITWREQQ